MADFITIILPNILEPLSVRYLLQEDKTDAVELKCSHGTGVGQWDTSRNDSITYEQDL